MSSMVRRTFLAGLLLLVVTAGAHSQTPLQQIRIGGISWYTDYDAALRLAQREHRPLWLHFGENPG
jgi:hypothetical protein